MSGKFEIYRDRVGKWRWRLKASNGQVCATGEAHQDEQGARRQCQSVVRASSAAEIEVVVEHPWKDRP